MSTRARRHLWHPSRRRLLAWLDADDGDALDRLTAHLESCSRCAGRLDRLVFRDDAAQTVETDDDATRPSLATAIRAAWEVPDELPTRIHRAIGERARADRELDLLLGLVSIGKDTAELLLPADEPAEHDDVDRAAGSGATDRLGRGVDENEPRPGEREEDA